ncbi:Protein PPP5D1 [Plecturocebus cupreus]
MKIKVSGWAQWLIPVISALREAKAGGSPELLGKLRQETLLKRGDGSCGLVADQLRSCALWPRLEFSGVIIARCSLDLLSSGNPLTSASQLAGTTGMRHHAWLNFFRDMGLTVLPRLVSNSEIQAILLLQAPKALGATAQA